MGETFKYVAPVAGAMGFSVEDTATAIGLMANAGIKGSQAGTALRSMFSRLAKPTDEVEAAMMKLGLSITNSDGSMRELDEIMEDLRKGFGGLTEAEQTKTAAQLAGQEAMSGLLAIVNTSEAEYDKLTTAIYSADGASKQMANTMANNLQGQFTLLKSSAEGFGLALYDKIQQPLTDMVSWAVDGLNQLTKAFNENGVDGLVEAAGNILSEAIDEIVNWLPKIVDLSMRVIDSFVGGINKNLDSVVGGAVSVVETLATGILNMLPKIVKLGLDLIVSLANGIAESLPTLVPTIIDVILKIVDTLTSPRQLKNLLDAALVLVVELAFGLMDAIPQLVNAINQIVMNIGEFLTNPANIAMILEAALQIIVALGTGVLNAVPVFLKNMVTFYGKIFDNFKNTNWGELGKNLVDGLLGGLKRAWASITGWFTNAWDNLFGGVGDFLGGIFGGGNSKISIDGSHRNGLDYVPYDGYIAELHKGERVLTASEAMGYGGTSIGNININIDGAKYSDEQSLASAIALEIQNMTDRRAAVYA
jgi:phage-related protein